MQIFMSTGDGRFSAENVLPNDAKHNMLLHFYTEQASLKELSTESLFWLPCWGAKSTQQNQGGVM